MTEQIEGQTLTDNGFVYHTSNMWESKETDKLDKALAQFFGEVGTLRKNNEVKVTTKAGGQYSYKFASLDEAIEIIKPALAKAKLFIQQPIAGREMITMIRHESGQFRASSMSIIAWEGVGTTSIQNFGGSITFLRRYGLFTFLGLSTDEDNDAKHAEGVKSPSQIPQQSNKAKVASLPELSEQQQIVVDEWNSQIEQCKAPTQFQKISDDLKAIKDGAILTHIRLAMGKQMAKEKVAFTKDVGFHEEEA